MPNIDHGKPDDVALAGAPEVGAGGAMRAVRKPPPKPTTSNAMAAIIVRRPTVPGMFTPCFAGVFLPRRGQVNAKRVANVVASRK